MSSDVDRISCNERLYPSSYRNTWDPDEDDELFHLARSCNTLEKETSKRPHLMRYVSFFNCS